MFYTAVFFLLTAPELLHCQWNEKKVCPRFSLWKSGNPKLHQQCQKQTNKICSDTKIQAMLVSTHIVKYIVFSNYFNADIKNLHNCILLLFVIQEMYSLN